MNLAVRFYLVYVLALLLGTTEGTIRVPLLAVFTICVCELLWRGLRPER